MKRHFNNLVSVLYSFIRFPIIKIFHWKRFHFYFIERFSPNTDIYFLGKGSIILGKKVRAHSQVRLRSTSNGQIVIEDNVTFNYGCMVTARQLIHIKKGVEFGPNVLIYDHDHDFRAKGGLKAQKYNSGEVIIGENTWIGAGTIILKNTRIGKNSVVGAGCVLTGNFPDNSIIIQKRDTKVLEIT